MKKVMQIGIVLLFAGAMVYGAKKLAPYVYPADCVGCSDCVKVCPVAKKGAITMVNGKAVIDTEVCISCGLCVSVCSFDAVRQ